ncbi:protein-disulfide reductase DsbD domain-containing protein [Halocynthiibacter namhaensis]|uniref:protein-disulfide reductase DsbD domain-containing protein n=1 Tax=Halocynthiibacter namhaensis TaxID=1290553 RepID=UPI0012DFFACE|nr:protein-disulfide reductase DsbD domain-containing protein [Halocynthiibacter namhaensis]
MKKPSFHTLAAVAALAINMCSPISAQAQNFESVKDSSVLEGWRTSSGTQMAAFRIELNDGWKTYWRAPGETGIPPQFDWSRSHNVASVQFHWPRPGLHDNAGVRTIGYKDELVLPVEITPVDPKQPVQLDVQMRLGVCETVCIPLTLNFDANLDENAGPAQAQQHIRKALAQQPQSGQSLGITSVRCEAKPIADGVSLTTSLPAGRIGNNDVVVFELSNTEIWVSSAQIRREGGLVLAQVDMVPPSATPFALDRSDVRITVIGDDRAINIQGCHG